MSGNVLVLGATGAVGGRVLQGLEAAGERVLAASRMPGRAAAVSGGTWVELDLERPETFPAALEGVDRVFLMARPGDDDPDRVAGPFLDAARRAGVARVVNLTAMGVEREPEFGLRRLELQLEASGLAYTHLRPNFFMQIFAVPPLLGQVSGGALRLPTADARLSYVDTRDIADVAVAALMDRSHAGKAYTLTGPESLDHHAVAHHLSAAGGRRISYEPVTDDEAAAFMSAAGLEPARVERLLGFYRRVRSGHSAPVSGDVEAVLGRPARSFAAFARDYAASWTTPAGHAS
ncbi:MAG: SDR family oxidoreductase [Gemmatimonadota bacterium]